MVLLTAGAGANSTTTPSASRPSLAAALSADPSLYYRASATLAALASNYTLVLGT